MEIVPQTSISPAMEQMPVKEIQSSIVVLVIVQFHVIHPKHVKMQQLMLVMHKVSDVQVLVIRYEHHHHLLRLHQSLQINQQCDQHRNQQQLHPCHQHKNQPIHLHPIQPNLHQNFQQSHQHQTLQIYQHHHQQISPHSLQ